MSICTVREPQSANNGWVGGREQAFLLPGSIYKHVTADHRIDGQMIEKYRIQNVNGTWTKWYYPGFNDVEEVHKLDDPKTVDETIWNEDSFNAGRRRWTQFYDRTHEVCYYNRRDYANPVCEWRDPQGDAWVTAVGDEFLKPESVYRHNSADVLLYQTRITKYRIKYANRHTTKWYYAGIDDHVVKRKQRNRDPDLWNKATKAAGRRHWTLFATHQHEVCHLPLDRAVPEITDSVFRGVKVVPYSERLRQVLAMERAIIGGRQHQQVVVGGGGGAAGNNNAQDPSSVAVVVLFVAALLLRLYCCCNDGGDGEFQFRNNKAEQQGNNNNKTGWQLRRRPRGGGDEEQITFYHPSSKKQHHRPSKKKQQD